MSRQTSRQAYQELIESGKQRTQCEVILNLIENSNHSYTLKEISRALSIEINAVSGRVNDLKKTGKIVEYSRRKCSITGRLVVPVGLPSEQGSLF